MKNKLLFILRFSLNDFKSKYSGSVLGGVWAVAEPLITILIYRFVYTVAFGQSTIGDIPYYIWLSVGVAVWFFISEGLKAVCGSYRDYSYLIKKVSFNKKALPYVRAFSSLYSHILFIIIVMLICLSGGIATQSIGGLVIMTVICFLFILLLGKILAILCGYIKDISHILGVMLNISFWLTPIFWNIEPLSDELKQIVNLNPAALIAEGYRNAFFYGELLSLDKLCYLIFILIILYIIAYISDKKLLPDMADKL